MAIDCVKFGEGVGIGVLLGCAGCLWYGESDAEEDFRVHEMDVQWSSEEEVVSSSGGDFLQIAYTG